MESDRVRQSRKESDKKTKTYGTFSQSHSHSHSHKPKHSHSHIIKGTAEKIVREDESHKHLDIKTYRLNRPRSQFNINLHVNLIFALQLKEEGLNEHFYELN